METGCEECVRLRSESRATFTKLMDARGALSSIPKDSSEYSRRQAELQKTQKELREAHKREDSHRRSSHMDASSTRKSTSLDNENREPQDDLQSSVPQLSPTGMSSPLPDWHHLKEIWKQRLDQARAHLYFARDHTTEIEHDCLSAYIPGPRHHAPYAKALRAERLALIRYHNVLQIYTDLIVDGIIPDENAWLNSQTTLGSNPGTDKP